MRSFTMRAMWAAAVLGFLLAAALGPGAVPVARADRGDDRDEKRGVERSRESLTDVVVKLEPGVDIHSVIETASSWAIDAGDDGRAGSKGRRDKGARFSATLAMHFPGTDIYLLHLTSGDATSLAKRLASQKGIVWAEAGIFTPSSEASRFRQVAYERFRMAAYERFRMAAYERFRMAAYERFSQAVYDQFRIAAYEVFAEAAFEGFSQALFERFSQAAFEQFGQAVEDGFRQAAYDALSQADLERFTHAVYERFRQAVYDGFRHASYDAPGAAELDAFVAAVYERFRQAAYEEFGEATYEPFRQALYDAFLLAFASLVDDPDFRLVLGQLVAACIGALRDDQLSRALSQAALEQINAREAREDATGAGVVVAVVDTGVYSRHWFLGGAVLPGIDLVDGDDSASDEGNGRDDNGNGLIDEGVGHGTFIAGLIHLVAPDARILPVRVQDDEGDGWSFLVAEGIYRAVNAGADVINLSLSIPESSKVLRSMIDHAVKQGVLVIAAVGNDGQKLALYPAAYDDVIGVGAVDSGNLKASFSNYGNRSVDVAAPGVDLYGPYPVPGTAGMAHWSGTSFATALVSGEAALLFELADGRRRAADRVRKSILKTATSLNRVDRTYGDSLGRGLINLSAAVIE